ncbi:hypothetical protein G4B88_025693, partial [Cannabis sativa]
MLWGFLNKVGEPLLKSWPLSKLTQRALHTVMQHIHHEDEDEDTNYVCAGPVNKVLNMICCWVENPNSDAYMFHLSPIKDYLWLAEDGLKMQIKSENSGGNPGKWYRHISKGGWAFSTPDNSWIVSDCTAEALEMMNPSEIFENIMIEHKYVECTASVIKGLKSFTEKYKKHKKKEIEECIRKATEFIESKQEEDGSWYGSWGVCYNYATYFAVKGLIAAGRTYQTSHSIRKASTFLLSKQLPSSG